MRPVFIGVAGGSGSGKTTVSQAILGRVGGDQIAYLQHDAYYRDRSHLPLEERAKVNYDHPDSLETRLMVAQLKELRAGQAIEVPIYDFARHIRMAETRCVEPCPIVLVEGILIFVDRALREMFDIKIFVDTDSDLRFIRRLRRDITERGRTVQSVMEQYLETVRPMHLEFVEPSKRYADVIIPEGGYNTIAVDMVVARINAMLEASKDERPIEQTATAGAGERSHD
ncbi:MAG: uridine kinase [Chloroflexi bacterium]|nr:uridine kinase [Chloroflexota bacterium]